MEFCCPEQLGRLASLVSIFGKDVGDTTHPTALLLYRNLALLIQELKKLYMINPLKKYLFSYIQQIYDAKHVTLTEVFKRVLNCNSADELGCYIQALELSFILRRLRKMGLTNLTTPFDFTIGASQILSNQPLQASAQSAQVTQPPTQDEIFQEAIRQLNGGVDLKLSASLATSLTQAQPQGTAPQISPLVQRDLEILTAPIATSSHLGLAFSVIRRKLIEVLGRYMGLEKEQLATILGVVTAHKSLQDLKGSDFRTLPYIARFLSGLLEEISTVKKKTEQVLRDDEVYRRGDEQLRKRDHTTAPIYRLT